MALSVSYTATPPWNLSIIPNSHFRPHFSSTSMISSPTSTKITLRLALCRAAKKQGGPPVRTNKKKKKKKVPAGGRSGGRQRGGSRGLGLDDFDDDERDSEWGSSSPRYKLPSPPAGFVLDDAGKVLMVSDKRIVTVDSGWGTWWLVP